MATTPKTSAKKPATKVASPKVRKSVRSSKTISPALAAYSSALADAVQSGKPLGSDAAEMVARTAAAKVARRGTRSKAKAAVHADVAHEAAIAELLPLLAHHRDQARNVAEEMLRTYGGLDEAKVAIEALKSKIAAMPTSVTAAAKKKDRVKKAKQVVVALVDLPVTPENHKMRVMSLDARYRAILKRAHLLPDQLKRETKEQKSRWNVSPKAYKALDQYKEGVRAVKGWPVWLWESGWLGGDGASTFHGTSTKPAHGKKDQARERDAQKREAQRRNGVRDGKEQLGFRADFERSENQSTPCVIPACTGFSRRAFEARGVRGMELANGKAVCRTHGEMLIGVSRSGLDVPTKVMLVSALIDHGQEPDEKLLAVAAKPEKHYAKPIPAHAVVGGGTVQAVLASPAFRAIFAAPVSGNGHGPKDSVPCMICNGDAPAGPRWQWKVVVHDDLNAFVADPQNSGRVCQVCGPTFFGLSKKTVADQPAALAGMIAARATSGKRPQATTSAMVNAVTREDFPGYVIARRQAMNVPAQQPMDGNSKPPCPIPGCKLVLMKVNPFKSQVPGMEAANGIAVCGVHVKALAQIAHAQVTAEKRASMVNALLHPAPANYDGFEQALDEVETVQDLAPAMA